MVLFALLPPKRGGERSKKRVGPWECTRHVKSFIMCVMVSRHSPGTAKANGAGNSGPSVTFPYTVSITTHACLHHARTRARADEPHVLPWLISHINDKPDHGLYSHNAISHIRATQKVPVVKHLTLLFSKPIHILYSQLENFNGHTPSHSYTQTIRMAQTTPTGLPCNSVCILFTR